MSCGDHGERNWIVSISNLGWIGVGFLGFGIGFGQLGPEEGIMLIIPSETKLLKLMKRGGA